MPYVNCLQQILWANSISDSKCQIVTYSSDKCLNTQKSVALHSCAFFNEIFQLFVRGRCLAKINDQNQMERIFFMRSTHFLAKCISHGKQLSFITKSKCEKKNKKNKHAYVIFNWVTDATTVPTLKLTESKYDKCFIAISYSSMMLLTFHMNTCGWWYCYSISASGWH